MAVTINASTSTGLVQSADTSGEIELQSNGTTALKVNTNEGIQILNCLGVGNATPSTSGAGITFPATQSASTDANTLDDYEEGTFTPVFTGSGSNPTQTSGTATGLYIKTGKLVWVSIQIAGVVYTGGSGNLFISGLPFTVSTGNGEVPAIYETNNPYPSGRTGVWGYTTNGLTTLGLVYAGGSSPSALSITISGSPTQWNMYTTFCYRATA